MEESSKSLQMWIFKVYDLFGIPIHSYDLFLFGLLTHTNFNPPCLLLSQSHSSQSFQFSVISSRLCVPKYWDGSFCQYSMFGTTIFSIFSLLEVFESSNLLGIFGFQSASLNMSTSSSNFVRTSFWNKSFWTIPQIHLWESPPICPNSVENSQLNTPDSLPLSLFLSPRHSPTT